MGFFCGDEEMMVDKMVAASLKKNTSALPSYGRELVPYFVPGAVELCESYVNVNTDVDAHRREGASILDIPSPKTSENCTVKGLKPCTQSIGSPVSVIVNNQTSSDSDSDESDNHSNSKQRPDKVRKFFNHPFKQSGLKNKVVGSRLIPMNLEEKWAGPAYSASPSPDSLPLPAFLFNKCTL